MTVAPDDLYDVDTERVPGLELVLDEADPADVVELAHGSRGRGPVDPSNLPPDHPRTRSYSAGGE